MVVRSSVLITVLAAMEIAESTAMSISLFRILIEVSPDGLGEVLPMLFYETPVGG